MDGIGKEFMEKTKYQNVSESMQRRGFPQPPLEYIYDPSIELIKLPATNELHAISNRLENCCRTKKNPAELSTNSFNNRRDDLFIVVYARRQRDQ